MNSTKTTFKYEISGRIGNKLLVVYLGHLNIDEIFPKSKRNRDNIEKEVKIK